jgi:amino acid transporter
MSRQNATSSGVKLKRELRLIDLYFAGLTAVIGSGWIFGSLETASVAGPAAILSWLFGGIFILIIALVWAEVGTSIPVAGGAVRYAKYSHGGLAASIISWSVILTYIAVPAAEAVAVVEVLQGALSLYGITSVTLCSSGFPTAEGLGVALALSALFFFINYIGISALRTSNFAITSWKLIIPSLTVIAILIVGVPRFASNFTTPSFAPYGFLPVFSAIPATGVAFAYLGFRQPIEMAAEAKMPGRDIWRAILAVVGTSIILYTMLQVVFIGGFTWNSSTFGTTGVSPGDWSALSTSPYPPIYSFPFFYEVAGLGLGVLAILLAIDGVVSPSGTLSQYMASTARVLYGTSKEGFLSDKFFEVHGKYRVPVWGLITTMIVTIVLLVMAFAGTLVSSVGGAWSALVSIITTTGVFSYVIGSVFLPVSRKYAPDLPRPFKLPAYQAFSLAAFVISALLVYWGAGALIAPPSDPYGGYILIAVMLAGALTYLTYKDKKPCDLKSGLWVVAFLIFTGVLVALGCYGFGIIPSSPLPFAWIIDIIAAIGFYFWAINSAVPECHVKVNIDKGIEASKNESE